VVVHFRACCHQAALSGLILRTVSFSCSVYSGCITFVAATAALVRDSTLQDFSRRLCRLRKPGQIWFRPNISLSSLSLLPANLIALHKLRLCPISALVSLRPSGLACARLPRRSHPLPLRVCCSRKRYSLSIRLLIVQRLRILFPVAYSAVFACSAALLPNNFCLPLSAVPGQLTHSNSKLFEF